MLFDDNNRVLHAVLYIYFFGFSYVPGYRTGPFLSGFLSGKRHLLGYINLLVC